MMNFQKIVIGPDKFNKTLIAMANDLVATDYLTNGINQISDLNGLSYDENLIEYNAILAKHTKDHINAPIIAMEAMGEKYRKK